MTLAAAALLIACTPPQAEVVGPPAAPACPDPSRARGEDWRRIASDADRARLRGWRDSWTAALGSAPADRDPLFTPDRALADPLPGYGGYRCRVHHLGRAQPIAPVWVGCRVEEDKGRARFVVEDGAQRAAGHFYPDTEARAVFLGTLTIGDEARALRYGRDRLRDLAGFVERVDERRWRIALPRPGFGGEMDVIELVPA